MPLDEARIDELQSIVEKAVVIKNTKSRDKIGMGSEVTIKKTGSKSERIINIVGEFEADPVIGKISIGSPLGEALHSKKKGDKVIVKAPAGEIEYEVIKIK